METVSIRLRDIGDLDFFGKLLKENRSEIVRDLIDEGKKMKALTLYRKKKISLGMGAKCAGLTLSEFLDLLEEHNVKLNLTLGDAKQAMTYSNKLL